MNDKPDLAALFGAFSADTFLGLEKCDDLSKLNAPVAIIGAPCATPYGSVGAYCRNAPKALRESIASLTANIDRHNFDLGGRVYPDGTKRAVDCGDLPFDENDAVGNREIIFNAITQITNKGAVPIVLGGDDSIPIPMLQALSDQGPLTILQLDAHIDWRESHMGEDMGLSSTMRRASEMEHVENIVQVGARGIGSGHSDDLQDALDWGAKFVTARELHKLGVEHALAMIPEDSNIVICIDADAMDPGLVPGVIGRAPGGLNYYQMLDLIEGAAAKGKIVAMDFVEYMPEVDVDGLGALNISRLIAASLGVLARQGM
ncbi:MAG: arginase family protein [Paracoccaceae bacterium]|nr:arginase family protein [Paracoccaceae bacterium]MDG1739354.1 arginase family protein [Paracoccaceae bacterium]MDG2259446.1 arginase family protein [Paracoccaceae bacterium]